MKKEKITMKKTLKLPWLWILLLDFAYLFMLWPLLENPGILYPILPESGYDLWEEFAVMRLEGILAAGILFLALSAIGIGIFEGLSRAGHIPKKAGIVFGYLALAFFTFFAGTPALGRAREKAKRISCQSNMKQINMALQLYAGDFDDAFPPNLRTLRDTDYLADQQIYRCPSRTRPNPEFSDYRYFGNGRKRNEPPFPILRDQKKNHPGKYENLLYSDGRVASETSAER